MVEKAPRADMGALFDSGREMMAGDNSGDGAAFGDALWEQNQGGAQSGQDSETDEPVSDPAKLGRSLLAQGNRLVDAGMELLALGNKAEGMRLLRDGAERQRRGTLLLSQAKCPSSQPRARSSVSQETQTVEASLPHTSYEGRSGRSNSKDSYEHNRVFEGMSGKRARLTERLDVEERPADELSLIVQPGTRVLVLVNDDRGEIILNAVNSARGRAEKLNVAARRNHEGRAADHDPHAVSVTVGFSGKFKP